MEDEFVVCPSCGTRIKAGREFCLRCYGPLPTAERPIRPPIWVSLGLSEAKVQMIAAGVGAIIIGLVALIWFTAPPAVDDTARPAAAAAAPRPAAAPASSQPSTPAADADNFNPAATFEPSTTTAPQTDRAGLDAKRATYEAEAAKHPNDADLLDNLGIVLDQLGRPADAIPWFERAISLGADRPKFHIDLGYAAAGVGLWDRAVGEYRQAVRARPDDFTAQYQLALALHKKGDPAGAIPELQKAVAMAPNDPNAHLSLGVSLEKVGRVPDAVQEYRKYLTIQPNSADAARLRDHLQAIGAGAP